MAINFPTSLDTLTNPTSGQNLNSPSHSGQHSDVNDAIEALETKVGITGVGFNPASASASASIVLHEDTDNGTNKVTVIAPSAIASDKTLTLPDETGTLATESYVESNGGGFNQGFATNGKIVPSVASNNLTVSLKTLAGTDPSASDPVKVRIGDTIYTITSALSVTKNAATNWCNSGAAEFATKEIDYFVYLGYNATDGVVIGFSRFPGASSYDDFSTTTTNEKYCAISTITNAAATDYYEIIGRFSATLSAGAGYTWSVPTYTAKNLIQKPIYETRWLDWTPTISVSGGTAPTYTSSFVNRYKITNNKTETHSYWVNGAGGTAGAGTNAILSTIPFSISSNVPLADWSIVGHGESWESAGTIGLIFVSPTSATQIHFRQTTNTQIVGNDQSSAARVLSFKCVYEI